MVRLQELERLFEESSALLIPRTASDRAYARAAAIMAGEDARLGLAVLAFTSELVGATAVELAAKPAELRRLVERVESAFDVPRVAFGTEVLASPHLLQLPTAVAIEVQLTLLLAFTKTRQVSLWARSRDGDLTQVAHTGEARSAARTERQLAHRLLADEAMGNPIHAAAVGIPVEVWQQPAAALIVRGKGGAEAERMSLMAAAAPLITAILEREDLLGRRGTSGEAIVAATERRLARLRYDLHDGPQQDLVLLAEDLHLFSSQLRAALEGHSMKDRLLGELDDLQSKLVALDGDLRRISQAVQSPFLQSERVADSLAELVDDFTARTRIKPNLSLRGDLSRLTDSQQITLLSVIREALSNIREHSGARKVTITVTASTSSVDAKVTDDGRGFDPETTLVQAAREGHLGLVGMHERVRLLGGTAQIESRQGGPTVIAVRLPAGAPPAPTDDG